MNKNHKKARLITLFLFSMVIMISGTVAANPADNPVELEAFIDGYILNQMHENNIVGVTLSMVQDGEIILMKGYGYADREKGTPVDPAKTLFRPGSTSKLFTWTAIMQLVEQGKLDLDADINDYIDFEIPAYLYGTGNSMKLEPVTLHHLLTHTPGFEDQGADLFVLSAEEMLSLEGYLKTHIPARVFPPGEVMAYSNYGTALAGYIVERVSGQSFAEYIEENIFYPLGMLHSTFRQPLPQNLSPQMAEAYKFSNGQYHKGSFEYIAALPAGSMSSTAEDMAKFMITHLQNGQLDNIRILEAATAQEMHRQHFTHHPLQDGMAYGFIEQTINGRRLITHGGNTFLFATGCYLLPEESTGLLVSYNGGTGIEREALIKAFMDRYYPAAGRTDPVPAQGSAERAAAFTGEYHPNRGIFSTVEKLFSLFSATRVNVSADGYLLVNIMGSPQQFVEAEPGVYRNRYSDRADLINTLVFVPNREGTIMMCAEGPTFTMTKAPWYGSASLAGLIIGTSLILLLTAAAGWSYASLSRLFRREKSSAPRLALIARLTAALCGLLQFYLLFGLLGHLTDIDPAFGVPRFLIESSNALDLLMLIPLVITLTTLAMLAFTVLAWLKKYWTLCGRIHYSALTLGCFGVIWFMLYNNLL